MTGHVYTFAGGKGGVGKTTAVANVGAALAASGHDVAVVDADLGMPDLGSLLGVEGDATVHDVLAGEATTSEALAEGPSGLTVVPGDRDVSAYADADEEGLRSVVASLRRAFDVVLVDTGTGLRSAHRAPFGTADGVVLVTTPDDVALADVATTAEFVDRFDGEVLGVVLNRVQAGADVAAVAERLDERLLAVLPEDDGEESDGLRVTAAAERPTARAFRGLADSLEGLFAGEDGAEDLETVGEAAWFLDAGGDDVDGAGGEEADGEETDGESGSASAAPEADDDADSGDGGGVFGLFG